MTHDVAPPGPIPHAGQAPYPAHPAPQPHHGERASPESPTHAGAPTLPVGRPSVSHPVGTSGTGRGWLIAAGAGVGLALTAALLPLLRRRPEPPKTIKRKKAPRRRK